MTRRLIVPILMLLLGINTYSGLEKVMTFYHRFMAERALDRVDLDGALADLKKALEWDAGETDSLMMVGHIVQSSLSNGLPLEETPSTEDAFGLALGAVSRGIDLNPADSWGWFHLGSIYQGLGDARRRLARLERAGRAAISPQKEDEPRSRAEPAGFDPEDIVTVAAVLEALQMEPEFFFYHDYLGALYWKRGLNDLALREIRTSLALTPRLGAHSVLEQKELFDAVGDAVLEGIGDSFANRFVDPVTAARARAEALYRLDRPSDAIAAYRELRALGGEAIAAECDLAIGKLEQRLGRFRESIPVLERALEEGHGTARASSALYYLGLAQARLGDHERAIATQRRFLESTPGSLAGFLALAGELEAVHRSEEAERIYIAAVRKFPRDPSVYRHAIEHMRAHGKARNAVPYAEALRKLVPDDEAVDLLIEQLKRETVAGPK
ncbi:MAG: tetratricopeptide repeat protein [Acidobacteriota bacterium]